jgi:hypothetical protein
VPGLNVAVCSVVSVVDGGVMSCVDGSLQKPSAHATTAARLVVQIPGLIWLRNGNKNQSH